MYNIIELFSGIGSQAKALRNLNLEIETVGTCEWDIHAIIAYDLIHNSAEIPQEILRMSKEELLEKLKKYTFSNSGKEALDYASLRTYSHLTLQRLYTSILRNHNYVDVSSLDGADLPGNIDIMTYSFPCQDLSNVGAFHGYNKGIDKDSGSRSSLLWQVGRILSEMKAAGTKLPRFLLMENVPTLLSQRHFPNFSMWIKDLRQLGYVSNYYELNASSFGLPQNRPRLLMISVYVGDNTEENDLILQYFKQKKAEDIVEDYRKSVFFHEYSVSDLLRTNYTNKKIFAEALECTPNDTVSRQKIWDDNPKIVLPGKKLNKDIQVIRTITTKQDRNPNSGNLYFESGVEGRSKFRYLTPRECLLFMGFTDEDFKVLKKNNLEFHKGDALFARDKIIRMAGNSIPVKLLEGIFLQIIQIDQILSDFRERNNAGIWDMYVQRSISEIRSQMFKRGIRSRIPNSAYPEKADIIYPRYKTAIYICDCFWHGHDCAHGQLPTKNHTFWETVVKETTKQEMARQNEASDMGWTPIAVWVCELEDQFDETMDSLKATMYGDTKVASSG